MDSSTVSDRPLAASDSPCAARVDVDTRLHAFLATFDPRHWPGSTALWTPGLLREVLAFELDELPETIDLDAFLAGLGLRPARPLAHLSAQEAERYRHWQSADADVRSNAHRLCVFSYAWTDRYTIHAVQTRDGQLAWAVYRRETDATQRWSDFLRRIEQTFAEAALLAPGYEAQLQPLLNCQPELGRRLRLLPPPNAPEPTQSLFRPQAMALNTQRLEGEVLLQQPASMPLLVGACVGLLLSMLLAAFLVRVPSVQSVELRLTHASGSVTLSASAPALIERLSVQQGDRVRAGQVLAVLHRPQLDGMGNELGESSIDELNAQLAAIDVESKALQADAEQQGLALERSVQQWRRSLSLLGQQLEEQAEQGRLAQSRADRGQQLLNQGMISPSEFEQLKERLSASRMERLRLQREQQDVRARLADAERELQRWPLQLAGRQADLTQRRSASLQQLRMAELGNRTSLVAPRDAEVEAVLAAEGDSVKAQQPVLMLADPEAPLLAELRLPNSAAGLARRGQTASLRLDAYPYERYGHMETKLSEVSDAATTSSSGQSWFLARAGLPSQRWPHDGERLPLRAGMTGQAHIVLESPRLIEWLIEPLRRHAAGA